MNEDLLVFCREGCTKTSSFPVQRPLPSTDSRLRGALSRRLLSRVAASFAPRTETPVGSPWGSQGEGSERA